MADKIKIVGLLENPELVTVEAADVHYFENVTPGTKIVKYKGQSKRVTVTADGKVPVVTFKEPVPKEEKVAVETAKAPKKVEGIVTTGINITSDPDQLMIYLDKKLTAFRTPHLLVLRGTHIIGVEDKIIGQTVTIKEGEIKQVHIVV